MNEMEKEIRRIRVSLSRLNTKLDESLHTFVPATQSISTGPNPYTTNAITTNIAYQQFSGITTTTSGTYLYISPEKIREMQKEIENIRWHLKQLNTLAKNREKTKNI
jgi:hypothetical protein